MGYSPEKRLRQGSYRSTDGYHRTHLIDLCTEWEADEIESGLNPYRPPRRQIVDEWWDIGEGLFEARAAAPRPAGQLRGGSPIHPAQVRKSYEEWLDEQAEREEALP